MASIPNDSNSDNTYDRPIELDPLPEAEALPASVMAVIMAIRAIVAFPYDIAFEALAALIAPIRQWPEGSHKAAVRAAKDAKLAEMYQARAASQRQAMPVTQAEAPQAPQAQPTPRLASWARIRSGQFAGAWGARIPSGRQYVRVGDVVRVEGSRGASLQRVVDIVWGDNTATVAAVEEIRERAVARASTNTPATGTPVVERNPVEIEEPQVVESQPAAESAQEPAQPAGPVTHEPTGPSIFDRPRSERQFRVGQSETRSDVQRLISERDFIAGAIAEGSMLQWTWVGGGSTTLGKVTDGLIELGREVDAPGAPSAERHAGRAVEALRNRDLDTARLPTRNLPDGISAQWLVGRKLSGGTARAGDAYGEALLIISLKDDDTLMFDGDTNLANAVRSHYAMATAKESLKSEDLTAWLGSVLRRRHGAVKRGACWYIPGGQADAARALFEMISKLWGDHEVMPVTTGKDLFRALTRGLANDVAAVAKSYNTALGVARDRARAKARKDAAERHGATAESIDAEAELAYKRADVSSTVASGLLKTLASVAAYVAGYETVLGSESVSGVKASIETLRSKLDRLADDASLRAAMLELA